VAGDVSLRLVRATEGGFSLSLPGLPPASHALGRRDALSDVERLLTSIEIEQKARQTLAVVKAHGKAMYVEQGGDYDGDAAFFETVIECAQGALRLED
jgi:hypothetical protein